MALIYGDVGLSRVFQNGEAIPSDAFQVLSEAQAMWRAPKAEAGDIAGTSISRLRIERRLEMAGAQLGSVDGQFDAQTRGVIRWYQEPRAIPVT